MNVAVSAASASFTLDLQALRMDLAASRAATSQAESTLLRMTETEKSTQESLKQREVKIDYLQNQVDDLEDDLTAARASVEAAMSTAATATAAAASAASAAASNSATSASASSSTSVSPEALKLLMQDIYGAACEVLSPDDMDDGEDRDRAADTLKTLRSVLKAVSRSRST